MYVTVYRINTDLENVCNQNKCTDENHYIKGDDVLTVIFKIKLQTVDVQFELYSYNFVHRYIDLFVQLNITFSSMHLHRMRLCQHLYLFPKVAKSNLAKV